MSHGRIFIFLWISQWGLWLAFANNAGWREILVGGAASAAGALAVARFQRRTQLYYHLRMIYLSQLLRVPATIISGTWNMLRATALRILGRELPGGIAAVHYRIGDNGPSSRGRRALAITFLTLGPNSLVLGFPPGQHHFFFHTLIPETLPPFMLRMGALPRRSAASQK